MRLTFNGWGASALPKEPVFRRNADGDLVPLWIDFESGDHLPAWAVDPCDCCPAPNEWNPPPLFPFCECMIGGVQLNISGLNSQTYWWGGCGVEATIFSSEPDVTCGNGTGPPNDYFIYVGNKRGDPRTLVQCLNGNLNGSFQTTDIARSGGGFIGTIHLGEYHTGNSGNRGVRICEYITEDYFDCGDAPPHPHTLVSVYDETIYVYTILLTGTCRPCVGGFALDYTWHALTQSWTRLEYFYPNYCLTEGWVIGGPCYPYSNQCHPTCPGVPLSGSGEGICVQSPACPKTSSGSYDTTSCLDAATVTHSIELH